MRTKREVHSNRVPRHLLILTAILVAAAISCSPAPEPQTDEGDENGGSETAAEMTAAQPAEVEAVVEELITAWEEQDLEAAVDLFTADAVVYDASWPPGKFEGIDEIRTWTAEHFEQLDRIYVTLTERSVRTVGRVAWFQARLVVSTQPVQPDTEQAREGNHLSMIWVRQEDGSYKCPLFHASPRPTFQEAVR